MEYVDLSDAAGAIRTKRSDLNGSVRHHTIQLLIANNYGVRKFFRPTERMSLLTPETPWGRVGDGEKDQFRHGPWDLMVMKGLG